MLAWADGPGEWLSRLSSPGAGDRVAFTSRVPSNDLPDVGVTPQSDRHVRKSGRYTMRRSLVKARRELSSGSQACTVHGLIIHFPGRAGKNASKQAAECGIKAQRDELLSKKDLGDWTGLGMIDKSLVW